MAASLPGRKVMKLSAKYGAILADIILFTRM